MALISPQSLVCGATVAALSYGAVLSLRKGTGTEGVTDATVCASETVNLNGMPGLALSVQELLPMLRRINSDSTDTLVQDLKDFSECAQRARNDRPPKPLIDAQQLKRKITRTLKELNKQGRRKLPIEASEAAEDFNSIVMQMNDQLHNMMQDTSLRLQESEM